MFSLSLLRSRGAFRRSSMSADHLTETDIAGFLDGDCTPSEHSRIEEHLEECAACRKAIVDVNRMATAYDPADAISPRSVTPPRRAVDKAKWIWAVTGTALAASLTFVVLNRTDQGDETLPSTVRSSEPSAFLSRPTLVVASPADDIELTGDSVLFRWNSRGGSVYQMTILDETGESVFARETPDTVVAVAIAPMLDPGHRYFWRVDAISDGVSATSVIRTFRVAH